MTAARADTDGRGSTTMRPLLAALSVCLGLIVGCDGGASATDAATDADAATEALDAGCDGCTAPPDRPSVDASRDARVSRADVVIIDEVATARDDAVADAPVAPPVRVCDPGAVVDLAREGRRVGNAVRWFGHVDTGARENNLVPAPSCPATMLFPQVFRFRVTVPGAVAIWATGGSLGIRGDVVVGILSRCEDGATISACDRDVPDARPGDEIVFVVGHTLDAWRDDLYRETGYVVGVDEGLAPAAPDAPCALRDRHTASCGAGMACSTRGDIGRCVPVGADGGPCAWGRERECDSGICALTTCAAAAPERRSCGLGCAAGLECNRGLCRRPGSVDAACRGPRDPAGPCAPGLQCVDDVCAVVAPPWGACRSARCPSGWSCVVRAQQGGVGDYERLCYPDGARDARCRTAPGVPRCDPGLGCDRGTCRPFAVDGEGCVGRACPGGRCGLHGCVSAPGPGDACRDFSDCAEDATCVSGRCLAPRQTGEPCDPSRHACPSGACVDGTCVRLAPPGGFCDGALARCAAGSTCVDGLCRPSRSLSGCSYRGPLACPVGARCGASRECELESLGRCGHAGDAPCPDGTGCEFGRCVRIFPCVVDGHPLGFERCGPDAHCAAELLGPTRCVRDGAEGGRCRVRGVSCDGGLACSFADLRCRRAVVETRAPGDGQPCGLNGYCDVDTRCVEGVCRRGDGSAAGLPCLAGVCADGLRCVLNVCITPGVEGDRCVFDDGCAASFRCERDSTGGVCRRAGGEGQRCRVEGPRCDAGLGCVLDRCLRAVARGAPCVPRETACPEGQSCPTVLGAPSRCVDDGSTYDAACRTSGRACDGALSCGYDGCQGPWLPLGAVCRLGTAERLCAAGLDCVGNPGECRAPGTLGGSCATLLPRCPTGAACIDASIDGGYDGVCLPVVGEDSPSASARCADGLLSVMTATGPRCRRPGTEGAPCRADGPDGRCDSPLGCDPNTERCR